MLGGESCPVKNTHELGGFVARHVRAVRTRVPGFSQAMAVIVMEGNFPLVAESVKQAFEQLNVARTCFMCEEGNKRVRATTNDGELRAGMRTTGANKPHMVAAIHELLMRRALRFHAQFTAPGLEQQLPDEGHPRDNIIIELLNFKREIRAPRTRARNAAYVRPTIGYSGRHAGGGRARDDYVMALGFVTLMFSVFVASPKYRGYR